MLECVCVCQLACVCGCVCQVALSTMCGCIAHVYFVLLRCSVFFLLAYRQAEWCMFVFIIGETFLGNIAARINGTVETQDISV